jgi:hypothetical protein
MAVSSSSLDGRRFVGIVLKRGDSSGDADMLIFEGGRFRSSACDQYGYGDGPYHVVKVNDGLAFEAETESPKYGQLRWHGMVHGARLDATLTMVRDGQPAGEKWILAGEPDQDDQHE